MKISIAILCILHGTLLGCSSKPEPEKKPTGVIPAQQLQALEKAKEIDKLMQERKQQLDDKLKNN